MTNPSQDEAFPSLIKNLPRYAVFICAYLSIFVALVELVGWCGHFTRLIQIRPDLTPMQFNTALCILSSGLGLLASVYRHPRLLVAFGMFIALIGVLTLYEYCSGISLGIDHLFFKNYVISGGSNTGRMSPSTAIAFSLMGLSLLFIAWENAKQWRYPLIGVLAALAMSLSVMAVLGYAVGLPGTYSWGRFTKMAPQTACVLGILGFGFFSLAWKDGRKKNETIPRWVPVPVALGGLLSALILWIALEQRQIVSIAQVSEANAAQVKSQIEAQMGSHLKALKRMAQRWQYSGAPTQSAWENDAQNYVNDFQDFQAIEWVDTSYHIRWVVPLKGNENVVNLDLTQESRRRAALLVARDTQLPILTRPIHLAQGGNGFVVYMPIESGTNFDGLIVGVFRAEKLFDTVLPSGIADNYSILISDRGEMFYERNLSPTPKNPEWIQDFYVNEPGVSWNVQVWPTPGLITQLYTKLPVIIFLLSLLFTIMVTSIVGLAQAVEIRAGKLRLALAEVKTLSGLVPICGSCKKVRDDNGYWDQVETYVTKHTQASFSHGLCPDCTIKQLEAAGIPVSDRLRTAAKPKNNPPP